jgi:hypothetical protein
MHSLEEMHNLGLLSETQWLELEAWFNSPLTNKQMAEQMPTELFDLLDQATALMAFNPEALGIQPS